MNKQAKQYLITGMVISLVLLISFVIAGSFNPEDEREIGYEFLDNGNVVHIWNTQDSFFFDVDSGIQFTNHYESYWTKNIFCIGYYDGGTWNKIYCADELNNFNKDIKTDDLTYVNATLWKDISYGNYDLRLGIQYHLGLNDPTLSITVYGKNIGIDIPFDLGFAWKITDIDIPHTKGEGDFIFINQTDYKLTDTVNLLFKNMSHAQINYTIDETTGKLIDNGLMTEYDSSFRFYHWTEFLKVDWNKNLNYAVKIYGDGIQENFYTALLINAGHFNPGQEKSTTFQWIDAEGDYTGIHWDTAADGLANVDMGMCLVEDWLYICDYTDDLIYVYWQNGTLNNTIDISDSNAICKGLGYDGEYLWSFKEVGAATGEITQHYMNGSATGTSFVASKSWWAGAIMPYGDKLYIGDDSFNNYSIYYKNGTYIEDIDTGGFGWGGGGAIFRTYIYGSYEWDQVNGTHKRELDGTLNSTWDRNIANQNPRGMALNGSYIWIWDSTDDEMYKYEGPGEDTIYPEITLIYPVNNTHYDINISTLNYTFIETYPDSCWYSTNDGITNSSAVAMGTNFTGITSIEGSNNWTLWCNDSINHINSTSVSFTKFTLDINLISPVNDTALITTWSNFTANYTIIAGDLKNVTYYIWYENSTIVNQTLVDISGTTNETTLFINNFVIDNYIWNTLACAEYSSETYCYFNEVNYTFLVGISVGDETYANWTYETAEQSFKVNLTLSADSSLVSANLVYNHTNYAISNISINENEYILTRVIDTPLNSLYFGNVSNEFYWSFTYIDESGTQSYQNTTTREQNVTYLVINICNATYNLSDSHALNFTMYDELTTDRINATSNATTLKTTFNYWIGSGSVYKNYSYSNVTNNATGEYNFCIFPRNETLYTNMNMEYGAVDYSTRTYHLKSAPLDNVTNNIKLELLPDADSVKFFIKVREGMVGFPDATVTISKYFTGEGVYRTTEIRETDVDGKFVAYLDLDQTYKFLVVKEGISYGTITEQALCTEAPCELTLQIEEAITDMWQGFYDEFAASVSYTLDYNDTLKLVTYTFNDLTGLAQYFALDVTEVEYDGPSGIILEPLGTYCNKTLSAVTGTLTCNLTNYTKGDFKATGYISRSPPQIVDYITFIISSIKDTLGNLGLFVSFLMIVVIGLVGCWNPAVGVVLTTFAVLMMKILGFVAFSYTTVILIIIMAIILVFKMKS